MPKELNGWLDEVVKAAKKRKAVIKTENGTFMILRTAY
jgi:hypothetical protein